MDHFRNKLVGWALSGTIFLAAFGGITSTVNLLQIHRIQKEQEADQRDRTLVRAASEQRSCLRDQKEAKAIRQILITARQNASREGRLSPRLAVQYVRAIDSIVVPNCSLKALGFGGVRLPSAATPD